MVSEQQMTVCQGHRLTRLIDGVLKKTRADLLGLSLK